MSKAGWTLEVDGLCDGWRLDRFIAHRIARLSRTRASRLVAVEQSAPDRPLDRASRVRVGQQLFVSRPLPDEGAAPPEPEILFQDKHLLVLNKPAGLASHPTASRFVATVTHWLSNRQEILGVVHPAHRLDVETSGVLLCTRTTEAARAVKVAFTDHHIQKGYWAVVEGLPAEDSWSASQPLGFDPQSEVRLKVGPGDWPARTSFQVLRRGTRRALVEARPETGRQHQIRVHAALSGHPLVGDKLYGPSEQLFLASLKRPLTEEELATLGHPRQALHARWLALELFGAALRFEAPWPLDLDALIA